MFETFRSSQRAAKNTKKTNVRLHLEELEGRCLLSSGFGPLGGITTGPDGDIWFLEKDRLGRIDPHTGLIQEFAQGISPDLGMYYPDGNPIAEGPDGSIWFFSNHQVTRFSPSTNVLTTFGLSSGSMPFNSIIVGADGIVWVLEQQPQAYGIARIDPATGGVQDYAMGQIQPWGMGMPPMGIGFAPDGEIWIRIMSYPLQELNPATGVVQNAVPPPPPVSNWQPLSITPYQVTPLPPLSASNSFRLAEIFPGPGVTPRPIPLPSWYNLVDSKAASDGSYWSLTWSGVPAAGSEAIEVTSNFRLMG
jgi:hypothetical protein